jgi:hypothetical protein
LLKGEPRACFGEMLHLDGSVHEWFTGEAVRPCLIAVSDDATKRVLHAALYPSKSTWAVMTSLAAVVRTEGLPMALYTDRAYWAFRAKLCRPEALFDELREPVCRDFLQSRHRPGLVEGAAPAEHALHQARLGAREDIAGLPLVLDGGTERVLDAAAVERADRLKLVELDREPAAPRCRDSGRQCEDLLCEPRNIVLGSGGREGQRQSRTAVRVRFHTYFRLYCPQHVPQPCTGAIDARLD